VENSQADYYWGCGGEKTGQNHLGKILMSVRQEIRQAALPVISMKSARKSSLLKQS